MNDLPLHFNDTQIDLYADDATQYVDITYRMWNINWIVIRNQWWRKQQDGSKHGEDENHGYWKEV
jgi:hypothetical protein